jgi:type I restriction enzyme, S subunit
MITAQSELTRIMDVAVHPKKGVVSGPFGSNLKTSDYTPDGVPIIRLQNVKRMKLNSSNLVFTSQSKAEELSAHSFEPGDILVSKLGDDLGRACIAPDSLGSGIVSADVVRIRVNPKVADVEYVMLAINNPASTVALSGEIQGVTRPRVSLNDIRNLEILLPSLPEQKSIVSKLLIQLKTSKSLRNKVVNSKRLVEVLRSSILKAICEGKLVLTEAELARKEERNYEPANQLLERILEERRAQFEKDNPGKKYKEPVEPDKTGLPRLPEGWTYASIDQYCSRVTDGEHNTPPRTEDGVLLLSARNIFPTGLNLERVDYISRETYESISKRIKPTKGDVLMTCSGTVGRVCVSPELEFGLVRSVAVLRPVIAQSHYLAIMLQSPFLVGQINNLKSQTAQANIFQGKIKRLVITLPPENEIIRIVSKLRELDIYMRKIESLHSKTIPLTHLILQSVLSCAFQNKLPSEMEVES